jgi:transposase-like protein
MAKEQDILKALAEIGNLKSPNLSALARKHNIHPSTLSRRARGVTQSRAAIISSEKKLLSDAQERRLLDYINALSTRGLHATPTILRNLVEEILKKPIGKNWVYEFVKRYKTQIKSVYLRGFDRSRQIADCHDNIAHFYQNVSIDSSD